MTIDGVTYGSGTASSKKLAKNKAGNVPTWVPETNAVHGVCPSPWLGRAGGGANLFVLCNPLSWFLKSMCSLEKTQIEKVKCEK